MLGLSEFTSSITSSTFRNLRIREFMYTKSTQIHIVRLNLTMCQYTCVWY